METVSFLQFIAPPLPHYITVGEDTYQPGDKHPSRRNVGVFDLLVVTRGQLFMGEEQEQWVIEPGHALVLRPDKLHYATDACQEKTHFYWLHFQTTGTWSEVIGDSDAPQGEDLRYLDGAQSLTSLPNQVPENTITPYGRLSAFLTKQFPLRIARHSSLANPANTIENLLNLIALERHPDSSARWQQQVLFQEVVRHLTPQHGTLEDAAAVRVAQQAASLIREYYYLDISHQWLRSRLNFHPTYVARCMRRVFGCTPLEYLLRYRIEQTKLLLMNSDMPIQHVADEVGIHHFSYFSKSFMKLEGTTPREYRKRYRT